MYKRDTTDRKSTVVFFVLPLLLLDLIYLSGLLFDLRFFFWLRRFWLRLFCVVGDIIGGDHYYGNKSVMFNPASSLDDRNHNARVELIEIYPNVYNCSNFSLTDYDAIDIEITISNDLYNGSVSLTDEITYANTELSCYDDSSDVGVRTVSFDYVYPSMNTSSEDEIAYFSYTSENIVSYGSNVHRHYADHMSNQQFDGRMFTTDSISELWLQIENVLEIGQLMMPWDPTFVNSDSTLYNTTHQLVGFSVSDQIILISCSTSDCNNDNAAYVVYTQEDYDVCLFFFFLFSFSFLVVL